MKVRIISLFLLIFVAFPSLVLADEHSCICINIDKYASLWSITPTSHSLWRCRQIQCIDCGAEKWVAMKKLLADEPHAYVYIRNSSQLCIFCGYADITSSQTIQEPQPMCHF